MTRPEGYLEPEWRAWLKRLPCVVCSPHILRNPWANLGPPGIDASEAHHLPTPDKALGRRVPDAFEVPLCRGPAGTPNHHPKADHLMPNDAVLDGVSLWYAQAVLRWEYLRGPGKEWPI